MSSASDTRLQVIGGGKMGQALVGGLLRSHWASADQLAVVEVDDGQRQTVAASFPGVDVVDQPLAGVDALVAVKPYLVVPVCQALINPTRVLSIAAGITTSAIESAVGEGVAVVRVMPNTPSLVGAGAAAVAGGASADDVDVDWAVGILSSVGSVEVVPESLLDAVTGLSGSGPAYVFLLAEALTDAGVAAGLPRPVADSLARHTIAGAGKLMVDSSDDPTALRAAVTTPAGTTAAGLVALEESGFRAAVIRAVRAAADRSAELGR